MPRIARVVVPGYPHHLTQRGNRRQPTFFCEQDYRSYISLMAEWCRHHQVVIWAYCLMPNHVHLVAVPATTDGLARAIGEAHRRYTLRINQREGWRGHLWQERFSSCVLDQSHLISAVRYVELNPVRAGLVSSSESYPWSSARAHLGGEDDGLVTVQPLLGMIGSWRDYLAEENSGSLERLRHHERTGRPLGSAEFVRHMESMTGRSLVPLRRRRVKGGQYT